MVKRWLLYLVVLVGCFVFYVCYQEWFSYLLLKAVLWLPLLSLVVSLPAMLSARIQKNVPSAVTKGMRATFDIRIKSILPLPAWTMKLHIFRHLTGHSFRLLPGYRIPTEHCGQLLCSCSRPWIYDYLGLFCLPMKKPAPFRVLVRPAEVETENPLQNPQRILRWKPKRGGGFSENHELRLYRPGDSIQHIHWKASAKLDKLILREPMEPATPPVLHVVMDGSPAQLDNKLGKLVNLGKQYLHNSIPFVILAKTGDGDVYRQVNTQPDLLRAVDALLACRPVQTGGGRK